MNALESELRITLEPHVSPEYLDVLAEGLNALFEHGYSEHELPVLNALSRQQEVLIIEETHDLILDALNQVCLMHRVVVDETTMDIANLAKFTRALLLLQFWDNPTDLLGMAEADAPNEDKLACMISTVGELSELEASDLIQSVDDNLIRGVVRLYTADGMSLEEDTFTIPEAQAKKLRSWREHMKAGNTLAYRMVKAGYKPGYAFSEYVKRIVAQFAQVENTAIATEIIPFLLLGRDTWINPLKGWRDYNQLLNLEINDITAIDAMVIKLLGEYDHLTGMKV